MRMSALFGSKTFEFFEIYGVSAWIKGVEPMRTRDVFYGQSKKI